ncbi:hypothetical protein BE21_56955 [Sorangium cellulosum]|uniref:Uncharacterized protein n=1 Tax=Sorangium cellulosum TaxID=56 RepID=A0A150T835_SORCE|nr:hypothetical protein BE21_56955 [Sorangium cellulosum]
MALLDGRHGGAHARSGRHAVVDEEERTISDVRRPVTAVVDALQALHLPHLHVGEPLYRPVRDAQRSAELFIDDLDSAAGDGADRHVIVARRHDPARDQHVERHPQELRYFEAHQHPASRQRQDGHVLPPRVGGQPRRELAAGVGPISKWHVSLSIRRRWGHRRRSVVRAIVSPGAAPDAAGALCSRGGLLAP